MKKIILSLAAVFVLALTMNVNARSLDVPKGTSGDLATSDYGGVSYSTISFSTANTLCYSGYGSIVGFVASSFTASDSDFISFLDTGAVQAVGIQSFDTNVEVARVYFSSTPTNGVNVFGNVPARGTTYAFPAPIRTRYGGVARVSTGLINRITVLWTKFGD